jgi:integrase
MLMASIRRRKRAKGAVWIVDYRDGAGVRRWVTLRTKREAEDALARIIPESRQAAPRVVDRDITLGDYAERWLAQLETEIKPRTLESYRNNLELHVLPAFGRFRLRDLHRGHLKSHLAQKRAAGLGKNSVRLIRAVLSVLLSDAVDDEIIVGNPALQLRGSRRRRPDSISDAERRRKIRPMEQGQLSAFLTSAQTDARHYPLFLLLARTGLRPGEAYALQWGDLDFCAREIRVERALSAGQIETPKTGQGRTVDMSEQLTRTLRRLEIDRMVEKLRRGWTEMPPWVFCAEAGTPLDESRVQKAFARALKRAKLPAFRLYDLRHTFASLLLAKGEPITYVSAQLGHADATTTLRWYARWLPRTDKRAVDALDDPQTGAISALGAAQAGTVGSQLVAKMGSGDQIGHSGAPEVADLLGGPSRTRTLDPLIKSPRVLRELHAIWQSGAPRRLAA